MTSTKLRAQLCEESRGRERDRPGQEFEQAIDAVNTREVAGVY